MNASRHPRSLRALAVREDGAALVEFAFLLPAMLLFFALLIECGRTYWSYQAAISGVREASRYLARVADGDICEGSGTLAGHEAELAEMIAEVASGESLLPAAVSIGAVTAVHSCVEGAWRVSPAPVATVTANLSISYPFGDALAFAGVTLPTLTTSVADSTRIFGQ